MKEYMLGLYEKSMPNSLSIIEKLSIAEECGYDYLELSIDETDEKLSRLDWDFETIKSLVSYSLEIGTPIKSICLSGHRKYSLGDPDAEVQKKSLLIMEKALILGQNLGVSIIQLAGYDVYYKESNEKTKAIFEMNLIKAVNMAAKYGITLSFETMETDFLNTVKKAVYWVDKVNSPWLTVYPDTGNITNAALNGERSVKEDLLLGAGKISALHVKESKPGIYREVPYGEGHVDFDEIIETAWNLGVRMFVTEFWDIGLKHWKEIVVDNHHYITKILTNVSK